MTNRSIEAENPPPVGLARAARRHHAARRTLLTALAVAFALLATLLFARFRGFAVEPASAAPPPRHEPFANEIDAAAVEASPIAQSTAAPRRAGDAIDDAVAPDGGVPVHPDAGDYRSPFARPGATPTRAKVAFLLNSIDDYDIETGSFTADFFVSFTSARPMPPLDLNFANGHIDGKESGPMNRGPNPVRAPTRRPRVCARADGRAPRRAILPP